MLTKGLVKSKSPDGYYVRIPYLETASSGPVVLRCSLSHEPALGEAIAVGDVVILGFEDHNADKPVVLGKLALRFRGDTALLGNDAVLLLQNSALLGRHTGIFRLLPGSFCGNTFRFVFFPGIFRRQKLVRFVDNAVYCRRNQFADEPVKNSFVVLGLSGQPVGGRDDAVLRDLLRRDVLQLRHVLTSLQSCPPQSAL